MARGAAALQNVVEGYQTTATRPKRLYRLTETNLALACRAKRRNMPRCSAPTTRAASWYERAYELIREEAPGCRRVTATSRSGGLRRPGIRRGQGDELT